MKKHTKLTWIVLGCLIFGSLMIYIYENIKLRQLYERSELIQSLTLEEAVQSLDVAVKLPTNIPESMTIASFQPLIFPSKLAGMNVEYYNTMQNHGVSFQAKPVGILRKHMPDYEWEKVSMDGRTVYVGQKTEQSLSRPAFAVSFVERRMEYTVSSSTLSKDRLLDILLSID